jgi:hypothetical protein
MDKMADKKMAKYVEACAAAGFKFFPAHVSRPGRRSAR